MEKQTESLKITSLNMLYSEYNMNLKESISDIIM